MSTTTRTRLTTLLLCAACLALSGCEQDGADEKQLFLEGREAVCTGNYQAAIPLLNDYLKRYPEGQFASRAGLFLGKAHVALGDYDNARDAWQATIDNFPQTLEGHKCRYKLGFLALVRGDEADARARFEAMAAKPDGPMAAEAKAMVAYWDRGRGEAETE